MLLLVAVFLPRIFPFFRGEGSAPVRLNARARDCTFSGVQGRIQEFSRGGIVRRYGDGSSPVEFRGKNPSRLEDLDTKSHEIEAKC